MPMPYTRRGIQEFSFPERYLRASAFLIPVHRDGGPGAQVDAVAVVQGNLVPDGNLGARTAITVHRDDRLR